MEAQRISLSTLKACGGAACGAGHDAENEERSERHALSRELRKLDIEADEIRKERETAEREFEAITVLPTPGNPPLWQFWRPWFVSRELQRRTLRLAVLNAIQIECGCELQRIGKMCAQLKQLLQRGSPIEWIEVPAAAETNTGARAGAKRATSESQ